jgi:hypothetical protein
VIENSSPHLSKAMMDEAIWCLLWCHWRGDGDGDGWCAVIWRGLLGGPLHAGGLVLGFKFKLT